jgi:hypothetical protein
MVSLYRPIDGPSHVFDMDERTPRAAIAQNLDLLGSERAGNKVIEDKVQTKPVAHSAGGCEPKAGGRETF